MTRFFPTENEAAAKASALGINVDESYARMIHALAPRVFRTILWSETLANLTSRPSPIEIPLAVVIPQDLKDMKAKKKDDPEGSSSVLQS